MAPRAITCELNPADDYSRGLNGSDFDLGCRWFQGLPILRLSEPDWELWKLGPDEETGALGNLLLPRALPKIKLTRRRTASSISAGEAESGRGSAD